MLILAHRGLPGAARPENSCAAVGAALRGGADGVEVDLRLTADGVLALSHDADLRRLTGRPLEVAASRWSDLRRAAATAGVRLARAEELLVLTPGRRVVLELKTTAPDRRVPTAAALRRVVRDAPGVDVVVSSFDAALLAVVRAELPGARTALLGDVTDPALALLRRALEAGHDEVHPSVVPLLAAPSTVAAAHACGVAVVPWTVNRRRDLRRLERLGVDAVITDVPAAARALASPAAA